MLAHHENKEKESLIAPRDNRWVWFGGGEKVWTNQRVPPYKGEQSGTAAEAEAEACVFRWPTEQRQER